MLSLYHPSSSYKKPCLYEQINTSDLNLFLVVSTGNVDIVNGNLKLILGLIWSLIMHYQIGQTKFPPKKLMLSWLKVQTFLFVCFLRMNYYSLCLCVCVCVDKKMNRYIVLCDKCVSFLQIYPFRCGRTIGTH